jgi:hypothetical protein
LVGIGTGYKLDDRVLNPVIDKSFIFSTTSSPAMDYSPVSYSIVTRRDISVYKGAKALN